jgi:hypothetical protein
MRIDEIDLFGDLLINGSTGSEGQILTYGNYGEFAWGTASGGSSGPTSSYFKTSGYNYVICETVNNGIDPAADAVINGTNLINAYNLAKNLDVGTKSATNRVVVLLMPGDYDLSSAQFQLDTSFIDLVGISSNPYNTILRSSVQPYTIQYTSPVDSALKNVYLKQGTNLSVDDNAGGGDGSYLRWENVIVSANCFSNGSIYGFSNIYGEFRNIKVLDSCYSFVTQGVIDGIFDNIEVGDNAYAFYTIGGSNIIGTYSNIEIGDNTTGFLSGGGISGRYENIKSGLNAPLFITNGGNISGYFENIKSSSDSFIQNNSGDITGTFKNIKIDGRVGIPSVTPPSPNFLANNNIDGIFDNIEIGDTDYVFSLNSSGYITGTFSNIKIGSITNDVFKTTDMISGSFKDITIGNVSIDIFKSNTSLIGEFENITIGNVTNNVFKATDMISGSFKNITIGDITNNNAFYADGASGQINGTFDEIKIGNIASTTGNFFSSGATMSGTFSNIEIGDASEWASAGISMFITSFSGSIIGSYKNIKVGSTSFLFYPASQDLNGTFENIEFGSTSYAFYANSGSILGTYSNIKTSSQQEVVFTSSTDLIGTFEDIEFSNSITTSVFTANSLSGIFKNIKLGDLSGIDADVFLSAASDLTGTFENIEVGNGNTSFDIFKSGAGNIIGTFSNITIGSGWNYVFNANSGTGGISGYFKDIYISALVTDYAFYGASVSSTTIIDNLWCDNRFYAGLGGKLLNSSIFGFNVGPGWALDIQADGTIIENCKIIGRVDGPPDYGIYSTTGAKSNVQILYTALYKDVEVATITVITPNYNIIEITT